MTDLELKQLKEAFGQELSNSYSRGWSAGAKTICLMILKEVDMGNDLQNIVAKIKIALGEAESQSEKGDEPDES